MIIVLMIWLGIYVYLFRLDGRLKKLEQQNDVKGGSGR
jgi:CcmD family protein